MIVNAFDTGEYIRNDDSPEIEPSEKYTRNYVKDLLNKFESGN